MSLLSHHFYHHHILITFYLLITFFFSLKLESVTASAQWQLLQKSIGISAMHMQLLSNDRIVIFDRTDFGPSNLSLPMGQCRTDPNDQALETDCTAHSVEYDSISNTFRPLRVQTDTWCSSGSTLTDGRLVQTGGFNDGVQMVRIMGPCGPDPACDWTELPNRLLARRWYATDHILADGRVIVIGGRRAFNYEFFPKTPSSRGLFTLPFLQHTNEAKVENNLYPFVFLNVDGNLFIFANNRAILFDYNRNVVVRTYPTIPGGDPRSYPSTGSAVLLPLKNLEVSSLNPEVLICGGAPNGSYLRALNNGEFVPALKTCARMKILDPNPVWKMETMPMARTMGDMVILPNGDVLIINGAGSGTAGWELSRDPVFSPVIYHPDNAPGSRFEVQDPGTIPRLYHSSALLLRDGRVLVGGSNPHRLYNFTGVLFPTELSLEAFSPPYMSGVRPSIVDPPSGSKVNYGNFLKIKFKLTDGLTEVKSLSIKVTMIRPPFSTHSFSMSQRMLVLTNITPVTPISPSLFQVKVIIPKSATIAPPGFYMMFVVQENVPSQGIWVQLQF